MRVNFVKLLVGSQWSKDSFLTQQAMAEYVVIIFTHGVRTYVRPSVSPNVRPSQNKNTLQR